MKKILLPITVLITSASTVNVYATNGTVEFNGEIVQSTCNVTSGDQKKEVNIGKYPTTAFPEQNSVSASKAFTISLEKCEVGDYTLRFDGPTVAGHPDLLSVDKAGGVGIEILTNDEKVIRINQDAELDSRWEPIDTSGTAIFNLKARYRSFQDKVTPGTAKASATFSIEYK